MLEDEAGSANWFKKDSSEKQYLRNLILFGVINTKLFEVLVKPITMDKSHIAVHGARVASIDVVLVKESTIMILVGLW